IELHLGKELILDGEIVAQLGIPLDAMIAKNLRGIEGTAEVTAAIAALLRNQQRRSGILPVTGDECGKPIDERLGATGIAFDFGEIDPADRARRDLIAIAGAAEPLNALAENHIELADSKQRICKITINLETPTAQAIDARRGFEQIAVILA